MFSQQICQESFTRTTSYLSSMAAIEDLMCLVSNDNESFHRYDIVSSCISLHWRHNDNDGVSNHQPHGCLLNRSFRRRSKKTSKLRVTGLCVGNSPGTGEFPAQRASYAENVSIWWRHHGVALCCGLALVIVSYTPRDASLLLRQCNSMPISQIPQRTCLISHNAPLSYPTMHHFVTEICTCAHFCYKKCIVGYRNWPRYGLRWSGWYCHQAQHELCRPSRGRLRPRRPAQRVLCLMAVPPTTARTV